jgi:hypothetical protein
MNVLTLVTAFKKVFEEMRNEYRANIKQGRPDITFLYRCHTCHFLPGNQKGVRTVYKCLKTQIQDKRMQVLLDHCPLVKGYPPNQLLEEHFRSRLINTLAERALSEAEVKQGILSSSDFLTRLHSIYDQVNYRVDPDFLQLIKKIEERILPVGTDRNEIFGRLIGNEIYIETQKLLLEIFQYNQDDCRGDVDIPTIEPLLAHVFRWVADELDNNLEFVDLGINEDDHGKDNFSAPAIKVEKIFTIFPKTLLPENQRAAFIAKMKKISFEEKDGYLFMGWDLINKLLPRKLVEEDPSNKQYLARLSSWTLLQLYLTEISYARAGLTLTLTNHIATIFAIIVYNYFLRKAFPNPNVPNTGRGFDPFFEFFQNSMLLSRVIPALAKAIANQGILDLDKKRVKGGRVATRDVFEYTDTKLFDVNNFIDTL